MTISAKIIADSISPSGQRITTFELEHPRFIHAEFMTHRLFSRNAASSRAIPVDKAIDLLLSNTAMPIHWGKNQPGMSAKEECDSLVKFPEIIKLDDGSFVECTSVLSRENGWFWARNSAVKIASAFAKAGFHKQIVNRLLEPFTHIKVVVTATEYDNFFWLRCHPDAQPEIQKLAELMWQLQSESEPVKLQSGDWHVPYYKNGYWRASGYVNNDFELVDDKRGGNTLAEAVAVSSSCCAQVSYRRLDDSLKKAIDIYDRLVKSKPVHASPFEHQATPFKVSNQRDVLRDGDRNQYLGATHCDMDGNYWSGNFKGWTQNRQLIPENVCNKYTPNKD